MSDPDTNLVTNEEMNRLVSDMLRALRERLNRDDIGMIVVLTEYGTSPRVQWISTMDWPTSSRLLKAVSLQRDSANLDVH